MVNVTDLSTASEKFERRASQAGQDYEQGVSSTSDSEQQQATLDSAAAWESGVQQAISNGSFESGVSNPNKSWQRASLETGASRFTQGASQAGDTWSSAFSTFADTLEGLNLQPRGARGDPANYDRSRAVGEALHNAAMDN